MARTKEFNHDVVVERAMRLFWQKGYAATSIHDLEVVMGIGRGSLYATFGDKHALYLAALDRYQRTVATTLLAPLAEVRPLRAALRQVLERVVDQALVREDHGCFLVHASVERASCDPEVFCRTAANFAHIEAHLFDAFVAAQVTSDFAPTHDPRALARFFANAVQGLHVTARATGDRSILMDIVAVTLAVLS